jgi:hypothetical protein
MRELMKNKNIYLEFIFGHIIGKNSSPQIFQSFFVFWEFSGFQAKIVRPIFSERNDIDGWFFLPQIQLFKLYKIGYFSVDAETLVFLLGETPWNRPTGIITFFAINQEGVDQSFSSTNSTEISVRRFYAQNFITIGLALEELSCKRPDGHTDRF